MMTELIETEEVHNAVVNTPDNKLVQFSVTDAAIAEMREKFMPLTINGPTDKTGFQAVYDARMIVKRSRVDVDKKRKELNEDALKWQREVNGEAKRITAGLSEIEIHLETEEAAYNNEIKRIAEEKAEVERQRYQSRALQLKDWGFAFDDFFEAYVLGTVIILKDDIRDLSDEHYAPTVDLAKQAFDAEQIRLAEVKRVADLVTQRIANEQAEVARKNKEEADRLQSIADEQAKAQKAIDDERKQIEKDRRAMVLSVRTPQLVGVGFEYTGNRFKLLTTFKLSETDVIDMADGQFADLLVDAKARVKEDAEAKVEADRLEKKRINDEKKANRERVARLAPDKKAIKKHLLTVFEKSRPELVNQPESIEYLKQLYDGWDAFVKQWIEQLEAL